MCTFKKVAVLAVASFLGLSAASASVAFPERAVRVVVPYAAGGGADVAARHISKQLGELLQTPVIVENKGGAGGSIGAAAVAASKADGYSLLFDAAAFTINPALRKLPFETDSLKPLVQAVVMPDILVVHAQAPYSTVAELIAVAKAKPSNLTYASYGQGSSAHMLGELFNQVAGITLGHIPYKGGAPAIADLMAGHVTSYFASAASSLVLVQSGRLKALAVTSAERMPELPHVPTMRELGMLQLETMEWNGFFIPKDTPAEISDKLEAQIQKAIQTPEVAAALKKMGLTPVAYGSKEFSSVVQNDMRKWRELVRSANLGKE